MSHGQYQAAVEGWKIREAKNENHFRQLSWLVLNSYADRNKLKQRMQEWWPIITDPRPKKKPRAKANPLSRRQFEDFINSMK